MALPASVLAAWGLQDAAIPLDGGQGTSVRVENLVLKPSTDDALVAWLAGLADRTPQNGFLIPAPEPALDGRLVVDGWSATAYVAGDPVPDDDTSVAPWLEVLGAARVFHAAVAGEREPDLVVARTDRWALADRVAWGEELPEHVGDRSGPILDGALSSIEDEGLPPQLVHGDLSGNVLLLPGRWPAIIDVSPYWRPAAYADAVVVVDALLWWRTEASLLRQGIPHDVTRGAWRSLLARALVFRLLAFDEPDRTPADVEDQLPRYAELLDLVRDV